MQALFAKVQDCAIALGIGDNTCTVSNIFFIRKSVQKGGNPLETSDNAKWKLMVLGRAAW